MKKVIIKDAGRPAAQILKGFSELKDVYSISCVVADSQERANIMKSYIRLLDNRTKIIGPALTVKLSTGDLVDCLDALKVAQEGDVIVVDAFGETETSIWGGLMSGLCKAKGVSGAIVDGAIRDTDETRDMNFPIAAKAIVPRSTHSPYSDRYEPIEINVPIQCGGICIHPGDIIVADEIGVTVVPKEEAETVLYKARDQAEKEEKTRQRIKEGKSVDELLDEFGRI